MKIVKLILQADERNNFEHVQYKEFVGIKLMKQPKPEQVVRFKRKLVLLDLATKQYRKQHVLCEIIHYEKGHAIIRVV